MSSQRAPRIFISAGEPSGDLHGAKLVRALRERFPTATIEGVGGPAMAEAGAEIRHRIERLSAMGVFEIVGRLPAHYRLLRKLRARFSTGRYDLAVLIDYPGFHLRVAEAARRAGVRVLYYIAPQLWAWWPGRARRFAAAVDRTAVILPFEERFFGELGLKAEYVGHPLLDRTLPVRQDARVRLGLPEQSRVLGIFPGSRPQEVRNHWPLFREVAQRLIRESRCHHAVVAAIPGAAYPDPGPLAIHQNDPLSVFAAADAALAKSGTTTLEAALAGVPMIVVYRVHPLTYLLGRRLVTVPWISLVNLVAERDVVPELLQSDATPDRVAAALRPLLDPDDPRTVAQRQGLEEVRRKLASAVGSRSESAAQRVAAIAAELLA